MYAINTLAAACTPPESEKRSTLKPKKKANVNNNKRSFFIGYNAINRM
jgi:hypothetical protein